MPALSYLSTRQAPGANEPRSFEDVLLAGLAPDGGLYVPVDIPRFTPDEIRQLGRLDYPALAAEIMARFIGDALPRAELDQLLRDTYAGFDHKAVAPLKQLGPDEWVLELFHGPTIAFKDYALQVLGRLFDSVLSRRNQRVTIVGATSGDTGSAAIEACRDRANIDIFILYPHGRPSEVQRRQMTSVAAGNAYTLAVEGTFDDCQDHVKALFADVEFRSRYGLSAVNSINWARIMAQIVYYFAAGIALGAPDRPVSFAVPTGNFGNVYAGHVARQMGLPIERLVIGTNRNDILYRFVETGEMRITGVEPSLSPSMDIQVSSNFERLLFEVTGRDGARLARMMAGFRQTGTLDCGPEAWQRVRSLISAHRVDDAGTRAAIARIYRETGELLDPHSAIAVAAMQAIGGAAGIPRVALACAHPAKFPDIVEQATGQTPVLPPHLQDLMNRPERINVVPNDLAAIRAFIAARARSTGAAR
jgi:threonine synthase